MSGTLRSTLNEIEGVLIAATEPAFNKQGAKFKGIGRYRQVPVATEEEVSTSQLRGLVDDVSAKLDKLTTMIKRSRRN